MRWNRVVGIAVVLAIAAATPAMAGSEKDTEPQSTAELFIDFVRDAWNEDPALVALRARDKGYDLEQTLGAMGDEDQRLAEDGTITEKGAPVTPADPPAGVLAQEGEGEVADALDDFGKAMAKKQSIDPPDELVEDGTFSLMVLLGLMAEGYTIEQIIVDGLLAGGVELPPYQLPRIVDEDGRDLKPGDEPVEDPLVEGIITDLVTIVEGFDPQDPEYEARYDVKIAGEVPMGGDVAADLTAKGTLGTDPSGEVYLGRMKGKMSIPASEKCNAETVLVTITLRGDVVKSGKETDLSQSWGYRGSTGGGGEGFCISAAEAPQLVSVVPALIGSFRGVVAPGEKLIAFPGPATLTIGSKA